ncbi:hypothetical protein MUP95_09820 [bacterium]|nr:hypothetical protein [bacterium]
MKNIIIILLTIFLLSGCITTNYYSGRTLENGKTVLTPGVDNLIWIVEDQGIVNRHLYFNPSIGISRGLPSRFEIGIRTYFPFILEADLRHQINPRSFKWFDISANLHMGVYFANSFKWVSSPYYKYGLTISKEILCIQPYFGYYLNKNYLVKSETNNPFDYEIICFGLAIPYKNDTIYPECNYYKNTTGGKGFFAIGIGVRASLKKTSNHTAQ